MSDAPQPQPSANTPVGGWTADLVLFHLLAVHAASDRRYEQHFTLLGEAVRKAETATEKRFEGVNEFRNQLGDQQRTFIPRSEVDLIEKRLSEKIDVALKQLSDLQAERAGIKGGWGYAAGVVGFVLGLAGFLYGVFAR